MTPIELKGARVKLLPLEENHTEELFRAGNNPLIWTYMPAKVESIEDMSNIVQEALGLQRKGLEVPFVVLDQQTSQLVGSTRFLNISIPDRHLEIGWTWFTPDVWRTSINTECKYLLLRHCFETLCTVRVQLKTDDRNERSKRAIQRIGAKFEGVLRKDRIMYNDYIRDSAYFSIIEQEWTAVKARLEAYMI